jgi:hypothetical protein
MSKDDVAAATSRKLFWLTCVNFDHSRVKPYDFRVAFVIAQHINRNTGNARLSDETIADEAGGSLRNVARARQLLREFGWLTWRRTRTCNVYSLNHDRVSRTLDMLTASRDARREMYQKRKTTPPAKPPDMTPVAGLKPQDTTPVASRDMTPVADIHLRGTPLREEGSHREAGLRVEASGQHRPELIALSS